MRTPYGTRNQICLRALLAAVAVVAIWLAWAKAVGDNIDEVKRRRLAAEAERAAARQDNLDAIADQGADDPSESRRDAPR